MYIGWCILGYTHYGRLPWCICPGTLWEATLVYMPGIHREVYTLGSIASLIHPGYTTIPLLHAAVLYT